MQDAAAKPTRFTRLKALLVLLITLLIGAVVMVAMTWFVIGSAPRTRAVAVAEGIRVAEFAFLPDEDAYPAALAIAADGTLYTGSYATGTVWAITPEGEVSEILETRERIGSVTGLDVAADGTLYILDRITALEARGAVVWRYSLRELRAIVEIPADERVGVMLPDDIAVDREGNIYISDRELARVWRYSSDGLRLGVFWGPPGSGKSALTGLAFDAARDVLLITDSEQDAVFRAPVSEGEASEALAASEILSSDEGQNDYGFDGLAVGLRGEIYVALLNWNRVARLEEGELVMLAKDFRGASDLAYDGARDRLYVTNWNQFSLGFGTKPQLPFAIDVIEFGGGGRGADA